MSETQWGVRYMDGAIEECPDQATAMQHVAEMTAVGLDAVLIGREVMPWIRYDNEPAVSS